MIDDTQSNYPLALPDDTPADALSVDELMDRAYLLAAESNPIEALARAMRRTEQQTDP